MFERVIHTVNNDMVIHTEKTGMMRLVVETEYVGKIADVFDKATWSFDGLQPEQTSSGSPWRMIFVALTSQSAWIASVADNSEYFFALVTPFSSTGVLDDICDVPFIDKNQFDAESDLIESLLTRATSIVYSPKIDSLLEEFAGELAHIDPIPSGIDETNSDPKDDIRFIEQLLYDDTSSEDDSFEDINYVEASPPNSELFSLEEVQDDILHAKLLNIHLFIAKIELLNNNPTPDCEPKFLSSSFLFYTDNSSPKFKTFSDHTKDTSSGSTTTHANNSLPEYDSFLFEIEPDQGELSSVAMEVTILGEPRVYVPNVLPTHPTLYQVSDFSSSDDSFGSGLEVSFPSGTRNKIFDPRIFLEVQSKRFLSRDTFSLTYVSLPFEDRHYLSFTYVIRTFLPYFTYPVESPFLLSFGSEDIIFDAASPFFIFLL
nr:hypothetical protein [Tanacetum cinerariifolium]